MCLPEVNNTRKIKKDVVKTVPSENVNLEMTKSQKVYYKDLLILLPFLLLAENLRTSLGELITGFSISE